MWLEQAVCDAIMTVTHGVGLAQLRNGQKVIVQSQAWDSPAKTWVIQESSEAGRKGILTLRQEVV